MDLKIGQAVLVTDPFHPDHNKIVYVAGLEDYPMVRYEYSPINNKTKGYSTSIYSSHLDIVPLIDWGKIYKIWYKNPMGAESMKKQIFDWFAEQVNKQIQ